MEHCTKTGCGTLEKSIDTSLGWYLTIEEEDNAISHLAVARIYMGHPRLDPDRSLTLYHLNLLANNDVMGGHYGLGVLYQHGKGVEKDPGVAIRHFERAKKLGHLGATCGLHQLQNNPNIFDVMLAVLRFKLTLLRKPSDPRLAV